MDNLARALEALLGRPVTNSTGLTAKYDFTLTFSIETLYLGPVPPPPPSAASGATLASGPNTEIPVNIFGAVQSQLGLKLEPQKGSMSVIVIDRASKTSTEN